MNELRVIALTHKNLPLENIGEFHLSDEKRNDVLAQIKANMGMEEIMFLSTCNRVEIIFTLPHFVCPGVTGQILHIIRPDFSAEQIKELAQKAERYNGPEAIEHVLRVASSLDSVVIGEREIITQLRKAYEECHAAHLTGDHLRLVNRHAILTAKEIFTHTDLSKKPVSVVSLAWQEFREKNIAPDARILLVGAGQIIRNFSKFLFENGYTNLVIANRTLSNAQSLADSFGGTAISLDQLSQYADGFAALVSCTGSEDTIISAELFAQMSQGKKGLLAIDLALPADIDQDVIAAQEVVYVGMKEIQTKASANIGFRAQALADCEPIIQSGIKEYERAFHERRVERAMRTIPETIKEIKNTALGTVFAEDLENLDENSRELLEKILQYMEKKYISVPMKMAREVLLDAVSKN